MIAIFIIGLSLIGLMTFVIIRLSISMLFWISRHSNDKQHVFKVYFPYYIITLFAACLTGIVFLNNSILAIYYFSAIYFLALAIWRSELKSNRKKHKNFANEPNQTHLL